MRGLSFRFSGHSPPFGGAAIAGLQGLSFRFPSHFLSFPLIPAIPGWPLVQGRPAGISEGLCMSSVIDIALMLERWHQAWQGANDTSFSSKCDSPGHWMPSRKSLCGDRWRQRSCCGFPGLDHIRPGNYLSSAYTYHETARSLLSGEPSRRFRPASQSCGVPGALSPCPVETNRPRLYPNTPRSTVLVKPQLTVHFPRRYGRLPVRSCVYGRFQLPSELCGKLCIGVEVLGSVDICICNRCAGPFHVIPSAGKH